MPQPVLFLAPFKGLTTKIYRNAVARHFGGFDAMFAPFISGTGHDKVNTSKLSDVAPKESMLAHTVPQFLSNNGREALAITKAMAQEGYNHVNWNMGCPFSRIADKKRGCGILPYPEELDRMLHWVFQEAPINISIKTRLGYYRAEESIKVMEVLNRYPIHMLIVHARIGTQLYAGEVDLDGFAYCLSHARMPVVYNGDIFHKERFAVLQSLFPDVHAWMLGRGALINPFLALEIKGISVSENEKRKLLISFLDEIEAQCLINQTNSLRLLGYLKAIWFYIGGMFEPHSEILYKIKKSQSIDEYKIIAADALALPFAGHEGIEHYFRLGVKHVGDENYR